MYDKKATKMNLALASIFFFILVLLTVSVIKNLTQTQQAGSKFVRQDEPAVKRKGSVRLLPVGGRQVFGASEQIRLWAVGDSLGEEIGGYDLVLRYDPTVVEFISAEGKLDDYQAFNRTDEGTVFITAARRPEATAGGALDEAILAEYVFRPIGDGKTQFKFVFTPGESTDTNLVDAKANDILTHVYPLSVTIGSSLSLVAGQPVTLDDGVTEIELIEATARQANCADCLEYAKMIVARERSEVTLEFKAGGIAGFTELSRSVHGYSFELAEFGQGRATVVVGHEK